MHCKLLYSKVSCWVVYITHGKKYEYHTDFVGIYQTYSVSAHFLVNKLNDLGFISLDNSANVESVDDEKDFRDMLNRKDLTADDVEYIIDVYDNSFYKNGWDYTIKKYMLQIK